MPDANLLKFSGVFILFGVVMWWVGNDADIELATLIGIVSAVIGIIGFVIFIIEVIRGN